MYIYNKQILIIILLIAVFPIKSICQDNLPPIIYRDIGSIGETELIILPTNETDKEIEKSIHDYVKKRKKNRTIVLDSVAINENLSEFNILVYGTSTGNLWLKKYINKLPITIDTNSIISDKKYKGEGLRFISYMPNPQNNLKSVCIYTAPNAKDIVGINSVFHGNAHYHIAKGNEVIKSGFYIINNNSYSISEVPQVPSLSYFEIPELSKDEMYADFDSLASIIHLVFPFKTVNQKIYNVDIDEQLDSYRNQIASVNSTLDFIQLINKTINSCQGSHFWISDIPYLNGFYNDIVNSNPSDLEIPFFYHEGNYYLKHSMIYDGVNYEAGLRLLSCNNQNPDEIIIENKDKIKSDEILWDYELKRFYKLDFYKLISSNEKGALGFKFIDTSGKIIHIDFRTTPKPLYPSNHSTNKKHVTYLPKTKTLYIGLPKMDFTFSKYYYSELQSIKKRDVTINNIIIDVRNNQGGWDDTWHNLLSYIYSDTLRYNIKSGIKGNDLTLNYLQTNDGWYYNQFKNNAQKEQYEFLEDEEFLEFEEKTKINKAETILDFKGKTYFFSNDNVYSSTGNLLSVVDQCEFLISIGKNSSKQLGFGGTPLKLSLPNSGIEFLIDPFIDLYNIKKPEDVHHRTVENKIKYGLNEIVNYYNNDELNFEKFLNSYDPYFKYFLELIEKK